MNAARRSLSLTLVVLGVVAVALGALLLWVDRHVFDTDRVVATAHDVLAEDSVRQLLRTQLDEQITAQVGEQFAPVVDPAVVLVLDDPRFTEIFDDAVRQTHQALTHGGADSIRFDLSAIGPVVQQEIAAVDPAAAAQFPDLSGALRFELTDRSELPAIWRFVEQFHRAAVALLVFGVLLIGLALVIGPGRWALLVLLGVGMVATALVAQFVSRAVTDSLAGRIDDPGTEEAATFIADRFTDPLGGWTTSLLVAGGIVIVVGIAVRLLRPAPRPPRPPMPATMAAGPTYSTYEQYPPYR